MNIGELHIDKLYIGELQVDKAYLGETLVYGGGEPEPIEVKALKFEAKTPGQVLKTASRPTGRNLEYSYNGTTWTNWEDGYEIPFPSNNVIYLRGMNDGLSTSSTDIFMFNSCSCNVSGNIMHLLDYTQDLTVISVSNAFNSLFRDCKDMTFDGLRLPATTISSYCYKNMFSNCTSLVNAPELPATILKLNCYENMFNNCTSLVNAPELPAITLNGNCYSSMFNNCTSLVNAPELPATTLTGFCYKNMFSNCTSLVNAPELPATTLENYCYQSMFEGCTSLVNAPELPATTLENYCYSSMFQNCTSLVNAPELPATTLKTYCYQRMFRSCRNLNNITIKATDISANGCLSNWMSSVPAGGTFKCIQGVEYPTGNNGIPNGWTVEYV